MLGVKLIKDWMPQSGWFGEEAIEKWCWREERFNWVRVIPSPAKCLAIGLGILHLGFRVFQYDHKPSS